MLKYKYWDNRQVPSKLLLEITCDNILEADKQFQKETGLNPVKCAWIGTEVMAV